ncbi:hypothetical protein Pcinc_038381 [Petrolisthes cinctipes]|uniref:Uncharacterized protein n=1 Tax=Petrolisthes cinctipes TaxID=88211 RepID=A0AAE1BR41_PETCI|nr:hypothetical protein Pcinc_038381 [Petrolisthes cinctipes]
MPLYLLRRWQCRLSSALSRSAASKLHQASSKLPGCFILYGDGSRVEKVHDGIAASAVKEGTLEETDVWCSDYGVMSSCDGRIILMVTEDSP